MNDNTFVNRVKDLGLEARTLNDAIAYFTSTDVLVDMFGTIGALRGADDERLYRMIDGAYAKDKLLLAKMLFYARDIRGGLGERETFRKAINYCALRYPNIIRGNIKWIPEYGRWDDLFALIDTPLEDEMWDYVKAVYEQDLDAVVNNGGAPSLLAKWLPSADASSENTRKRGCYAAKKLGRTVYNYKREVKSIRRVIDTIEAHMSAKDWHTYDYSKVPSNAMLKYTNAFYRNDGERYSKYISDVSEGKAKINSSTLYPADIIKKLDCGGSKEVCQQLWNALPNYVEGENNFIVMADVSGSMIGDPMCSSIGLAIYFAERNRGAYKNLFMTFSANPKFVTIPDFYSIKDKYELVRGSEWGMNTNIEAAFLAILKVAIETETKPEDMPKSLIIITDMEFDQASRNQKPLFNEMQEYFKEAGYEMPNVVFWNVDSKKDTYNAKADEPRVQLVSGRSTSTFKNLIEGLNKTPYEMMIQALSSKRYDPITVQ